MSKIRKRDTDGVKPLLDKAEFGYDDYQDKGRVYVGTGSENLALAKKSELDSADSTIVSHKNDKNNPHNVTKAQIGLSNVDNTSDANKPISTATQTALNGKVGLTGNQTITGTKTFSSSPIAPTPTTDFQVATKKYVDDNINNVVSNLALDNYNGSYGIEWDETTDTYTRIGSASYTAIQSLMKRCVLNADGSVNYYLDPNNSSYKIDGSLAKLDGTDGNVMVEVPKTYLRYTYTDGKHRWEISLTPDTGFEVYWAFDRGGEIRDKRYISAYEAYLTGGKLISRSGVYPTVSQTLAQFRTAARANSLTAPATGQTPLGYWGQQDFALYELITLFAIIEYGTMNIQAALGQGRTALSNGTWVGGSYIGMNGLSNVHGNRSANYTFSGDAAQPNAAKSFMSYRGIENFFGNVWTMCDGVIFKGTTLNKTMWFSTNPQSYNQDGAGYTNSGLVTAPATGYGTALANSNKGFIVSSTTGGASNKGTTDYYYTSATDNTLALLGGRAADGLTAGPLYLHVADSAASFSAATVGARLTF